MSEKLGQFGLVLHAHLPWVLNHGYWPHGTNWVYEAAAETYIPLLMELNKLLNEGFTPKITIDISPVLCEMLANDKFKEGFIEYCDMKINGAKADFEQFKKLGMPGVQLNQAKFWEEFYTRTKTEFVDRYKKDLIAGFRELLEKDVLDIITCGATHGYSPLLSHESSIHGQFYTAVKNYKKHFHKEPTGTWLPECAYRPGYSWKKPVGEGNAYPRPGVEKFLSRNNISYFFIDTPLLVGGMSQGVYAERFPLLKQLWENFNKQYKEAKSEFPRSPFEPYLVSTEDAEKPVAFFTRDENTGILVWSGEHGYPGSECYLDFHKKHYKDAMGGGSGLRYWKVTGAKVDLGSKQLYDINVISNKLDENAGHFKEAVKGVLRNYKNANNGKTGMLCAPYDAELFGHWWFEGVWFINRLVRFFAMDQEVEMVHCRNFLETNGMPEKTVQIPEGSWGAQNGHYIWLNKDNTWTWEKIYEIEPLVEELVTKYHDSENSDIIRILKQICRENLIMQASDWQFLISTWSARDYAENRFSQHYEDIKRLVGLVQKAATGQKLDTTDWNYVGKLEEVDDIFDEIDLTPWIKENWKEKFH